MSVFDLIRSALGLPDKPEPIQREAEALYAALQREVAGLPYFHLDHYPTGRRLLRDCAPDLQAAVVEVAFLEFRASREGSRHPDHDLYFPSDVIKQVIAARPKPTPARVAGVLQAWASNDPGYAHFFPTGALLRLVSTPPTPIEVKALRHLRATLRTSKSRKARKLAERIDRMLAGEVPSALQPGGTWSAHVLRAIEGFDAGTRDAWDAVLQHLLDSRSAEPTRKGMQELKPSLDALGSAAFRERALEWIALGPMPGTPTTPLVPERDADYLKGFVWALGAFPDTEVARALADLAVECFRKVPHYGAISARVGNACVRVLGDMPGHESVAQLGRLRTRVKYVVALELIEKALAAAAAREGLDREALEELAVPTFDLDATGGRRQAIGDAIADIRIVGTHDVTLSWTTSDGRPLKNAPAAVGETHGAELTRLKKTVKDLLSRSCPRNGRGWNRCWWPIATCRSTAGGRTTSIIRCWARWRGA